MTHIWVSTADAEIKDPRFLLSKPVVGQNIALHATPEFREFYFYSVLATSGLDTNGGAGRKAPDFCFGPQAFL